MSGSRCLFGALVLLLFVGVGCESVGDVFDSTLGGITDKFNPMSPEEAVNNAFASYDPDERRYATAMISASPFGGEEEYVRFYRKLLETEPDPTVQAVLVKALGDHGDVSDALLIKPFLEDADKPPFVRWESAKALRKLHNPAVVDALVDRLLNDEDHNVRAASADALGQYATPTTFHALVGGLDDNEFSVVLASERSLKTLTGRDFGSNGADWLDWADENERVLFTGQQVYTWKPYVPPRGWTDRAQFWKKPKEIGPKVPEGFNQQSKKQSSEDAVSRR